MKKNKTTTDLRFIHNDLERTVPVSEIKDNDYQLSVSSYIIEVEEREEIDPVALELHARQQFLSRLEKELAFEKMVCEFENMDIRPFIKAIQAIVKKYDEPQKQKIFCENQMSIF